VTFVLGFEEFQWGGRELQEQMMSQQYPKSFFKICNITFKIETDARIRIMGNFSGLKKALF
jgi:hypothetical protein